MFVSSLNVCVHICIPNLFISFPMFIAVCIFLIYTDMFLSIFLIYTYISVYLYKGALKKIHAECILGKRTELRIFSMQTQLSFNSIIHKLLKSTLINFHHWLINPNLINPRGNIHTHCKSLTAWFSSNGALTDNEDSRVSGGKEHKGGVGREWASTRC